MMKLLAETSMNAMLFMGLLLSYLSKCVCMDFFILLYHSECAQHNHDLDDHEYSQT